MQLQWKREWVVPAAIGAACSLVGLGVGYILNDLLNKAEDVPEDDEQMEFDWGQSTYEEVLKVKRSVQMLVAGLGAQVVSEISKEKPKVENFAEHARVFANTASDDDWNWEEEHASRTPDAPYVITADEFKDGSTEYMQLTLTYYEGDRVLCDEKDMPIYDHEKATGELKFGHGSGDINVVYIRNHALKAEYEVIRDRGYFQVKVLGQDVEDRLLDGDGFREVRHSIRRHRQISEE